MTTQCGDTHLQGAQPLDRTPRQLGVIRLLAGGLTSKQAAAALGRCVATVELHLLCARRRTGCKTTAERVALAARAGLE